MSKPEFPTSTVSGPVPTKLATGVALSIARALIEGLEPDAATCIAITVASDFGRKAYGDEYIPALQELLAAQKGRPFPVELTGSEEIPSAVQRSKRVQAILDAIGPASPDSKGCGAQMHATSLALGTFLAEVIVMLRAENPDQALREAVDILQSQTLAAARALAAAPAVMPGSVQ